MYWTDKIWLHEHDPPGSRGLGGLLCRLERLLFGGGDIVDRPPPRHRLPPQPQQSPPPENDLGWLSLTCDADGHSPHAGEVICMGITPDDLDVHDPDGGDLSWISLGPVRPNG